MTFKVNLFYNNNSFHYIYVTDFLRTSNYDSPFFILTLLSKCIYVIIDFLNIRISWIILFLTANYLIDNVCHIYYEKLLLFYIRLWNSWLKAEVLLYEWYNKQILFCYCLFDAIMFVLHKCFKLIIVEHNM